MVSGDIAEAMRCGGCKSGVGQGVGRGSAAPWPARGRQPPWGPRYPAVPLKKKAFCGPGSAAWPL